MDYRQVIKNQAIETETAMTTKDLITQAHIALTEGRPEAAQVYAQLAQAQELAWLNEQLTGLTGETKSGRKFLRIYDCNERGVI